MITPDELRRLLDYDPITGVFVWRIGRPKASVGKPAGCWRQDGYLIICIKNHQYFGHRLAWLFTYGEWPRHQIDHINGKRNDNRICNLREATKSQNMMNQKGRLQLKGAYKHKEKWISQIASNKKLYYLGRFSTPEEAHAAYIIASKKLHGEFSCAC